MKEKSFKYNVLTLSGGRFLAHALALLSIPILTRMFSPEMFGLWDAGRAIAAIAAVGVTLSFDKAIVLAPTQRESIELKNVAFVLLLTISALLFALSFAFENAFVGFFGREAVLAWQVGLSLFVFLTGLQRLTQEWLTLHSGFTGIAAGMLLNPFGQFGLPVVLAYVLYADAIWLMLGAIAGLVLSIVAMLISQSKGTPPFVFSLAELKSSFKTAKKYIEFPLWQTPTSFSEQAGERLVLVAIGFFAGPQAAGFFGMAERLVKAPVAPLIGGMRRVIYRDAAKILNDSGLEKRITSVLRIQLALTIPLVVVGVSYAPKIVPYILGNDWEGAVPYVQLLLVMWGMRFLTNWLDRLWAIAKKLRLGLIQQVFYDCVRVVGLVLVLWATKDPLYAAGFFVIFDVIYNAYWLVLTFRILKIKLYLLVDLLLVFSLELSFWWVVVYFASSMLNTVLSFFLIICVIALRAFLIHLFSTAEAKESIRAMMRYFQKWRRGSAGIEK